MFGIGIGGKLNFDDGRSVSLLYEDPYKVILQEDDNPSTALPLSVEEFKNKLQCCELQPALDFTPRPTLTEPQIRVRDLRVKYIHTLHQLVTERGLNHTTLSTYNILIKEVEKRHPDTQSANPQLGGKGHPARSTISRWYKTWVQSLKDDDALASKTRDCKVRLDSYSESVLLSFLSNTFNGSKSEQKRGHYTAYCEHIERMPLERRPTHIASERTFRRRIDELKAFDHEYESANEAQRNQLLLTLTRKYRQNYALQRVEMDRITLNLCLIDDDTGKATEKVSLLVAIDCYSRLPVSVVVEIGEAENKENVVNLFQNMLLKDSQLIGQGNAVNYVVDNGPGFNNNIVREIVKRLKSSLIYTPALKPQTKPFIESFFSVMRKQFFKGWTIFDSDGKAHVGIPGYYAKRTAADVGVNLPKEARLTVSQFKDQLHRYLVEYSNKTHGQTHRSPTEMWNDSMHAHHHVSLQALPDYEAMAPAFNVFVKQGSNRLDKRGSVRLHGHDFASPDLKSLFQQISLYKDKSSGKAPKVAVHYNPFDARTVSVTALIPGENSHKEVLAYNRDLDPDAERISYEELAGLKPKSFGIYSDYAEPPRGKLVGDVDKLRKPKYSNKSKRSGTKAASFEENNTRSLSAEARVEQSHLSESQSASLPDAHTALTQREAQQANEGPPSDWTQSKKTKKNRKRRDNSQW